MNDPFPFLAVGRKNRTVSNEQSPNEGGNGGLLGLEMSPRAFTVAVGVVLVLVALACCWVAFRPFTSLQTADRVSFSRGNAATGAGGGHLTIGQSAALALIEGAQSQNSERNRRTYFDPKAQAAARLVTKLQTGTDAEAAEAIRGLASLGGEGNIGRLRALMNDVGWSDELRTEAGLAVLNSSNEQDVLAAIRGLAAIGGDANTDRLASMVHDSNLPQTKRVAAALGLGIIGTTQAGEYLAAAFSEFSDREVQAQLLDSLGHLPFPQIEETWSEFLGAPDTPASLRTTAVEALANSSSEAAPFLVNVARSDLDPNVRESAAWALSAHGANGKAGPDLVEAARSESEVDVRRRIYEALPVQAENPAASLAAMIQSETDLAARVAGFNAMGDAIRRGVPGVIAGLFDSQIVPELTQIALSPEALNIRMRAVFALRRASTPAALNALRQISGTETQPIAQAALSGLQTTNPKQ